MLRLYHIPPLKAQQTYAKDGAQRARGGGWLQGHSRADAYVSAEIVIASTRPTQTQDKVPAWRKRGGQRPSPQLRSYWHLTTTWERASTIFFNGEYDVRWSGR